MSGSGSFAELLRAERKRAGMTQEQLFDRSGVAVRTISDLERGVAGTPQAETTRLLAKGLALTGTDLERFLAAAGRGEPEALRTPLVLQRVLVPPTALLGRNELVGQVAELLNEPAVRLVSLLGPGGVGKTRVAAAVAARAARRFPDGVADADLAPVRDPAGLLPEVAAALGDESQGTDAEALARLIGGQRKLLLLDNFEQIVAGAPVLSRLLARCPHLKILCTSRIPLQVRGEYEVAVPPLALPGPHAGAAEIEACDAVQMFAAVARTRSAGWRVDDHNAAAVAAICRAVDGIPLALELAASRVGALGVGRIAALLADRTGAPQLLSGGPRDLPERQHSVAATIDWSHDLLDEDARALLRRLAVFPAEFSVGAAQEVCGGPAGLPAVPVVAALAVLASASLLRQTTVDTEPRYSLYQSMYEYATGKLGESGEGDVIEAAHTTYVLQLGDRAADELTGDRQAAWLERLEASHEDIRAALARLFEAGDQTGAVRLGGAIWRFWYARGHLAEGDRLLDRAVGDGPSDDLGPADALLWGRALNGAASLAYMLGRNEAARRRYEQAITSWRKADDRVGLASTMTNLGMLEHYAGSRSAARELYQQALAESRATGNRRVLGAALVNYGSLLSQDGELPGASRLLDEALVCFRDCGDVRSQADTEGTRAVLALRQQDFDQAERLAAAARELFNQLGDERGANQAVSVLAAAAAGRGEHAKSYQLFAEAARVHHASDDKWAAAEALLGQAEAAIALGRPEEGRALARTARALSGAVRDLAGIAAADRILDAEPEWEGGENKREGNDSTAAGRLRGPQL